MSCNFRHLPYWGGVLQQIPQGERGLSCLNFPQFCVHVYKNSSYRGIHLTRLLKGLNALMHWNYFEKDCLCNQLQLHHHHPKANFHGPPKCPLPVKERNTQPAPLESPELPSPSFSQVSLPNKKWTGKRKGPCHWHSGASL